MNNTLFKITGWGLLVVAWAWVVFEWAPATCGPIYESVATALSGASPSRFAFAFSELTEPAEPIKPSEPNPVLVFVTNNSSYVFVAGILGVAWCRLLADKVMQRRESTAGSGGDCSQ